MPSRGGLVTRPGRVSWIASRLAEPAQHQELSGPAAVRHLRVTTPVTDTSPDAKRASPVADASPDAKRAGWVRSNRRMTHCFRRNLLKSGLAAGDPFHATAKGTLVSAPAEI